MIGRKYSVQGTLNIIVPGGYIVQGVMLHMSCRNTSVSRGLLKYCPGGTPDHPLSRGSINEIIVICRGV